MGDKGPSPYRLPSMRLQQARAQWLGGLRRRLLEIAQVAKRDHVVDLGCGAGVVTRELVQRATGRVWALDHSPALLDASPGQYGDAQRLVIEGDVLPFPDESVDLVFTQFSLMWMPLHETLSEISRILVPGGVLVALEPDYDGLIEYPPQISLRETWLSALHTAGAKTDTGRLLPSLLAVHSFDVKVDLASTVRVVSPQRFELLSALPLTHDDKQRVAAAKRASDNIRGPWKQLYHLPVFGITATKPGGDNLERGAPTFGSHA